VAQVKDAIAGRYYQKRAIGSIAEQFTQARRKALLVMATGTGKTRTAIALVDLLQRAGWVKRALFLADRVSLVNQACNAFKAHLPESSPVNLVTEKDTEGRVYVCTYPTMMGMIDETRTAARPASASATSIWSSSTRPTARCTRSTARSSATSTRCWWASPPRRASRWTRTPTTCSTWSPACPPTPTSWSRPCNDGFLVPPRVQQVDLKFPREGIDYDALSDEEKDQWESLDWGDDWTTAGSCRTA
jgi:type I restriction enzyme R subunit